MKRTGIYISIIFISLLLISCTALIEEIEITDDNVFNTIVINLIGFFFMKSIRKRLTTGESPSGIILPLILLVEWSFLLFFLIYKPIEFFILLGLVFLPKLKEVSQGVVSRFQKKTKRKTYASTKGKSTKAQKTVAEAKRDTPKTTENSVNTIKQTEDSVTAGIVTETYDAEIPQKEEVLKQLETDIAEKKTQRKTYASTKGKSTKAQKTVAEAKRDTPKTTGNSVNTIEQTEDTVTAGIVTETYDAEIAQKKAALEQLENDIAEKKTQNDSLGSDAMAIMQKAKLYNEIKALKLQIDKAKSEIIELKNKNHSEE